MTKYCEACKQKIKGDDFIDTGQLDNPLLYGYWCRSCFLVMMYKVLDEIRMDINSISARLNCFMGNATSGETGNGKEGNSKTDL